MNLVSLRAAGEIMFSTDLSKNATEFGAAFQTVSETILYRVGNLLQMPPWFPTLRNLRFNRAKATMERVVNQQISERRHSENKSPDLRECYID